jgi:hypothetical protein
MISSVHLSPKMSRVVLIGHVDLLVIFFILKEYTNYLHKASRCFTLFAIRMLLGELMAIKPDIPRKVRVLQKIDYQKEKLRLWKTKYGKRL